MKFEIGEKLLLKVSPIEGAMYFGNKGKLSLRYIGTFEVLKGMKSVAYKFPLPHILYEVHSIFHVSMLKKYYGDRDYIIQWDSKLFDKEVS